MPVSQSISQSKVSLWTQTNDPRLTEHSLLQTGKRAQYLVARLLHHKTSRTGMANILDAFFFCSTQPREKKTSAFAQFYARVLDLNKCLNVNKSICTTRRERESDFPLCPRCHCEWLSGHFKQYRRSRLSPFFIHRLCRSSPLWHLGWWSCYLLWAYPNWFNNLFFPSKIKLIQKNTVMKPCCYKNLLRIILML